MRPSAFFPRPRGGVLMRLIETRFLERRSDKKFNEIDPLRRGMDSSLAT
jgi:hypothetical protein